MLDIEQAKKEMADFEMAAYCVCEMFRLAGRKLIDTELSEFILSMPDEDVDEENFDEESFFARISKAAYLRALRRGEIAHAQEVMRLLGFHLGGQHDLGFVKTVMAGAMSGVAR